MEINVQIEIVKSKWSVKKQFVRQRCKILVKKWSLRLFTWNGVHEQGSIKSCCLPFLFVELKVASCKDPLALSCFMYEPFWRPISKIRSLLIQCELRNYVSTANGVLLFFRSRYECYILDSRCNMLILFQNDTNQQFTSFF